MAGLEAPGLLSPLPGLGPQACAARPGGFTVGSGNLNVGPHAQADRQKLEVTLEHKGNVPRHFQIKADGSSM